MKKQQLILSAGGLVLLVLLYFFGNTIPPVSTENQQSTTNQPTTKGNSTNVLAAAKQSLTAQQSEQITQLENSVVRGDVKEQQIRVYNQLAHYWQDSLQRADIGTYYLGEAAKLENSEKSLNFAARLMLNQVMSGSDAATITWVAKNAKALYDKVLEINPANDSAKVELGACYLFGAISEMPMEGIQKIKEVLAKDSTNMYAELMLGLADIRSQQYDKAIERLEKVAKNEPHNIQAIFNLAESYERKGDKANAIKWYKVVQNHIDVPAAKQELEERINSLK